MVEMLPRGSFESIEAVIPLGYHQIYYLMTIFVWILMVI